MMQKIRCTDDSVLKCMAAVMAGMVLMSGPVAAQSLTYIDSPFLLFDLDAQLTASIDLADVDGDGDLDVLTANGRHWAQPDFVYFNAGNGRLLEAAPLGVVRGSSYVIRAGDLDGDGDLDAVVVRDSLPVQLFENDGSGRFTLIGDVPDSGGAARGGLLADIDADGTPDLIVARRRGPNLLFRGDGAGGFSAGEALPGAEDGSTGLAIADVDQNGSPDILVACRDGNPSYVLLNDGTGSFAARAVAGSEGDHRQVAAADFDGDGRVDLILASVEGLNTVYPGDGAGSFTQGPQFGESGRVIQALAAADLDGDGDVDLVEGVDSEVDATAGDPLQPNRVYWNDGRGGFTAMPLRGDAEDTYGVAIGDMDGDGLPDLVFANSGNPNRVMIARPVE